MNPIKKTFTYGSQQVILETGEIARQAHGAVLCTIDDTVVLATVVAAKEARPGQEFFPLTVDYVEKTYAAGKIPGGFFKREGRPSEKETLTCRLIDRPIRPLFPDGFYNEVQVVATVMSCNPEVDPDIPAMIGVSAALTLSGIPFSGPIGACRVGYIDGQYILNPTATQLKGSQLNLVVAGTAPGVPLVEFGTPEPPAGLMLGGAAGAFATEKDLDVTLSFEQLGAAALPLGSGAVMVFDDTADIRDVLKRTAHFFADESCGKCYPCQLGTHRQYEILDRLASGRVVPGDLERLSDVGRTMIDASLCGLGQTAATAVLSAMKIWPEMFERKRKGQGAKSKG